MEKDFSSIYKKFREKELVCQSLRFLLPKYQKLDDYVKAINSFSKSKQKVISPPTLSRILRGSSLLTDSKYLFLKEFVIENLDPQSYLKDYLENKIVTKYSPLESIYLFLHDVPSIHLFAFLLVNYFQLSKFDYVFCLHETTSLAYEISYQTSIPYYELHSRLPLFDDENKGISEGDLISLPYRISGERIGSFYCYAKNLSIRNPKCLILLDYIRQGYLIDVFSNLLDELEGSGSYIILSSFKTGFNETWGKQLENRGDSCEIIHYF